MKIKLDENVPTDARVALARAGHDVDTTVEEGLAGRDDPEVFEAARREGRFFVTQDLDFSDVRKYVPGTHPGILLPRFHAPSRRTLTDALGEAFGG